MIIFEWRNLFCFTGYGWETSDAAPLLFGDSTTGRNMSRSIEAAFVWMLEKVNERWVLATPLYEAGARCGSEYITRLDRCFWSDYIHNRSTARSLLEEIFGQDAEVEDKKPAKDGAHHSQGSRNREIWSLRGFMLYVSRAYWYLGEVLV